MPADLNWLIAQFPRFNAGEDPVLMAAYLKRLRKVARARGHSPSEFLDVIEEYLTETPTRPLSEHSPSPN